MVQAGLVLGGLEALLDRPPGARDLHEAAEGGRVRRMAEVEGQLGGARDAPADQQRGLRPGRGDQGPVVAALALGPVAAAEPLPGPLRKLRGQGVGPAAARRSRQDVSAGDGQDVGDALFFQVSAQRAVVAVGLVSRYPSERDPGRDRPFDHQLKQLRLGPEPRLPGDARGGQPRPVPGPGPRQVKLPVDQRPALRGGVGQEPPSWQFVIFPAVPVYCRCTPAEHRPPFSNPVSSPIRVKSLVVV